MQSQSRILEDLARVASSAMGVAQGMRSEVEARLRDQFERAIDKMDLVTREEFDAVKAMAIKAREEQEVLAERLAKLEAAQKPKSRATKSTKAKSAKKTAASKDK